MQNDDAWPAKEPADRRPSAGWSLHARQITRLTRGSDALHFFYDAQSMPAMVKFNGALYSYVHNLQGDIVGIVDSVGSLVVEYKYDAWGKPTLVRTLTTAYEALAELNPFRYRGYVYDEETELYYLRSRYYNTKGMRFLNADDLTHYFFYMRVDNCYAYCYCCPTMYVDKDGFAGAEIDLGSGWRARIDGASSNGRVQRHIHIWKKGGPSYSQNEDGSVHDGQSGNPPEWVRRKLRELRKWNWRENSTPAPATSPTPAPSLTPAPAPAPLPLPTAEPQEDEDTEYSSSNVGEVALGLGGVAMFVYIVWCIGKVLSAVPTGGASLVLP